MKEREDIFTVGVMNDNEEVFIVRFPRNKERAARHQVCHFAINPDLDFGWDHAACMMRAINESVRGDADEDR